MIKIKASPILLGLLLSSTIHAQKQAETEPQSYLLPEIVIKSLNLPETSSQNKISNGKASSTISAEQISQTGANSVSEILTQQAEIQNYNATGANPQFYIRGQRASILINGEPINQFDSSAQNISAIPPSSIEKIIISPSSSSIEHGSMGIGGTINIITKKPSQMKNKITISPSYPGWGSANIQLAHSINKNWSVSVNNQTSKTAGYRDYSKELNSTTNLVVDNSYDGGELNISLNSDYKNLEFPGALSEPYSWKAGQTTELYISRRLQSAINWQQKINANWELNSFTNFQQLWANGKFNYPSSVSFFNQNYKTISTNNKLVNTTNILGHKLTTILGNNLSHQTFDQTSIINYSQQNNIAFYIKPVLEISPSWQIGSGYRYAYITTSGNFIKYQSKPPYSKFNTSQSNSYNVYGADGFISHNWNKQFKSAFHISRSYQLPFIDQSSAAVGPQSTFGLQPETAISYEINNSYNDKKLSLAISNYLMNINNQIAYSSGDFANINLPPTQQLGMTVSINYKIFPNLNVGASSNIAKNTFRSGSMGMSSKSTSVKNKEVPGVPMIQAESHFNYKISSNFNWFLQLQYFGRQYADGDFDNSSGKVASYWLTNTSFRYKINHWSLQLSINNIFNKKYNNYVLTYGGGSNAPKYYYPADGINGTLSISYTFN